MLNLLFGSAARVKILNLFLLHPENKYYLRQVARELGLQVNSVQRELNNLNKFGLVIAEKEDTGKRGKKYFSVDKDFILFSEIKDLFSKAQIFSSQKFIDDLKKICQPKFLALTGIFTNATESLTDILLVGRVSRPAFLKLIKKLETELARDINYTIMDEKEFKYRRTVMDIFLYNVLDDKAITIINTLEKE